MSHAHSSHLVRISVRHGTSSWIRRSALLGSIVVGLALVGDQALAGSRSPGPRLRAPAASRMVGAGLTLATSVLGAAHRSVTSMSDGSIEVVSLLVIGFSLMGVGRALSRSRLAPPAAGGESNAPASPAGLADAAARSRPRGVQRERRRAAR